MNRKRRNTRIKNCNVWYQRTWRGWKEGTNRLYQRWPTPPSLENSPVQELNRSKVKSENQKWKIFFGKLKLTEGLISMPQSEVWKSKVVNSCWKIITYWRFHINAHELTDGNKHVAEFRFCDHPIPVQVVHAESPKSSSEWMLDKVITFWLVFLSVF